MRSIWFPINWTFLAHCQYWFRLAIDVFNDFLVNWCYFCYFNEFLGSDCIISCIFVGIRFEQRIYDEWSAGVDEICGFNLAQSLLTRNKETQYIAVNFDPQVILPKQYCLFIIWLFKCVSQLIYFHFLIILYVPMYVRVDISPHVFK